MSNDCIFCRIVAGDAPASIVYRDGRCTAFLDNRPVNPGHLLVVPNDHADGLGDLPAETGGRLFQVAQRLAGALQESDVQAAGVNLLLSDGRPAGQEIDHVHVHVIPRHRGDSFGFRFGRSYSEPPDRAELDRVRDILLERL